MATLKDFTFSAYKADGSSDFSDSQTKQLISNAGKVIPDGVAPNDSVRIGEYLKHKILEPLSGESLVYFTVQDLLECVEPVVQVPIQVGKVFDVMNGELGLLKGNSLLKPLWIGVDYTNPDAPEYVIQGGRHRLSALVSLFKMYNVKDDYILSLEIPCFVTALNSLSILADNKSRGATKFETSGMRVSADGVNIRDPKELWVAYTSGRLSHLGTATTQRSNVMRLLFVLMTDENPCGLTEETRGAIAAALPTQFGQKFPGEKYALKDNDFIVSLMEYSAENLESAVKRVKETGITNMARATTGLASTLMHKLSQDKAIKIPAKPVKEPKTVKEAAAKAPKEKKEKSPSKSNGKGSTKALENLPKDVAVPAKV